jgi:predicted phage-related endonuclease
MLQRFLMKRMLKSQLKGVPEDQQEKLLTMIEKNPELFQKIAKEIQNKMKNENKEQMAATMEVMKKYQNELRELMQE